MRRVLIVCVVVAISCAAGPDFDLGGSWNVTENLSSATGISCTVTGELLLAHQSGSSLFGGIATRDAICQGAPVDFNPGGADEVIQADISGSDVRFQIDLCDYQGTITATEMTGTMTCELGVGGQPTQFTGSWQAARVQV